CHLDLKRFGHFLGARTGDYRYLVFGRVEADSGPRHVVQDDSVEPLALELRAGPLRGALPVLGREAHDGLARAALGGQGGYHVGGLLELDDELVAARLRDLGLVRRDGPEVRYGGGHEQHVGFREEITGGLLELGGRLDVDVLDALRAWQ